MSAAETMSAEQLAVRLFSTSNFLKPGEAERLMAELKTVIRTECRTEALNEAAEVAVRIARSEGSGGSEMDQRACAAAARVGRELRIRMADGGTP